MDDYEIIYANIMAWIGYEKRIESHMNVIILSKREGVAK